PGDWHRLTTLSSPAMSPDGRRVAFTVTTVVEKENKRHSEVWVVPVAGGAPARYTAPGYESSDPQWSPDGRYLVFSSRRPGGTGGKWALRMDVPGGEAMPLENYPMGSTPRDRSFAVWSDTASAAAADSAAKKAADPFEKMAATARPPFGAITRPLDPARFDGRHVVDLGYKRNGPGYVPNPREARRWHPAQLWTQRFDGSAKRQLTNTQYSHRGAVVSPDGRRIAFIADAELRPDSVVSAERDSLARLPYDEAREAAPRNETDIFLLDVANPAQPRRLATIVGTESDVAWSADGERIAFISRPARTQNARLYVIPTSGGSAENLLGDWQYEPDGFTWLPNGDIAMDATIGGRTALFHVSPRTRQRTEVIAGRRRISGFSFDEARARVAFVATSLTRPTELYVADANGRNERRLTSFNDAITKEIAFADAERFTYPSVGGVEIEGWLMKPHGYQAGRKYPLVVYIHGGPHSAYGENWFDEFQNLAGAGMWVLFTNPRGSSGYGADFTFSTRGRWGAEDYQDIMKAVDIAAARPDVDSTRMGVTGGSYGGFMTAWITTKTNRFKAAQADRMISNWGSWYGSSDAQGLTEFEFYGKPWENPAMYDTLSPIRYVTRVKTPTLIVQSEEDHRTPMGDAEQWFTALEKQDVPVEFVRYPRSTHDLSRTGEPWLLVDRLGRLRQWFGHWLQDHKPGEPTSKVVGQ
ncbi:MAG TPA: S9 family peptidase, partial [Gemmatimonadaceae bacterium]|nr:S9 family peptidase [Gemmatimonadaceae bacterium]